MHNCPELSEEKRRNLTRSHWISESPFPASERCAAPAWFSTPAHGDSIRLHLKATQLVRLEVIFEPVTFLTSYKKQSPELHLMTLSWAKQLVFAWSASSRPGSGTRNPTWKFRRWAHQVSPRASTILQENHHFHVSSLLFQIPPTCPPLHAANFSYHHPRSFYH